MKKLIFKDETYHQMLDKEIDQTAITLQRAVDEWKKLDLCDIADLQRLIKYPKICYESATTKIAEAELQESTGRFGIDRKAYKSLLQLPDPSEFYSACQNAVKAPYGIINMWGISPKGKVYLDENSNDYIQISEARDIFATSEAQEKAFEVVKEFEKSITELDKLLNNDLLHHLSRVPYLDYESTSRTISFNHAYLKDVLNKADNL